MPRESPNIDVSDGVALRAVTPRALLDGSDLYINRELSWLEFNQQIGRAHV